MLDNFRKLITFLVGVLIVVFGLLHECPRVGAVAIGLLLMGIFTVPEALGIIKGRTQMKEEE